MKSFIKRNGPWLGLFMLTAVIAVLTSVVVDSPFLSARNLTNLLRQASINGTLAMGMTFIILTGGIDLSIGSLVALCGVVLGISQVHWGFGNEGVYGAFISVGIALASGLILGAFTGAQVAILKIPPFVITLGMMVIFRGVALIFTNGTGISPMSESLRYLAEGYIEGPINILLLISIFGVIAYQYKHKWADAVFPVVLFATLSYSFFEYKGFPVTVLILILVLLLSGFVLNYTVLGRCIFAIGSNEQAAYYSGVPLSKVKWLVYAIMGLFSGLSSVLLTARLNGAVPTAGQLFELDAIASVVIGGTSLKGGSGSIIGSFVGALMIATLNNGMDMLGVPSFYQMVFKGMIIIIAVSLDRGQREGVS